jgi:hypothetical protein
METHQTQNRDAPNTGWAAIKQTWSQPNRWVGVGVAAAPTIVFVVMTAAWALYPAIIGAGVTAIAGLVVRLARRESLRSAVIGVLIVGVCAAVAAVTGQARGFFLLPAMIPFVVILVCLITIVVRRPLTGLLLNKVTGGPANWNQYRPLRRVHLTATWAAIGINTVNAVLQVIFYTRNDTIVLAVAHIATGPAFATLVAVTIVAARRNLPSPE